MYVRMCACMCMYVRTYLCMYVCMCVCMYVCMHYVCVYACTYIRMLCINILTYTYVIFSMLYYVYMYVGRILLMKYYNFLWRSFPKDHITTHVKFYELFKLDKDLHDDIIAAAPEKGNRIMLDICTIGICRDVALIEYCGILEKFIVNPKLSKIMKVFKNGQCVYNCTTCHGLCIVHDRNCLNIL